MGYDYGSTVRRWSPRRSGLHRWYRASYFVNKHIDDFVLHELESVARPGDLLVDSGCGAQPFRRSVEQLGMSYLGLDYSVKSSQLVDSLADAASLPIASGSVDVVLCTELLEHVPDLGATVREIARVLAADGTAIITVPFMFGLHEQPYDFQRPTPHLLRRLAEQAGLEVTRLERLGGEAEVMATTWENYWNMRVTSRAYPAMGLLLCLRTAGNLVARISSLVMPSPSPHSYLTTGMVLTRR